MTKYTKTLKTHLLACLFASAFISNAVANDESGKESFVALHTSNPIKIDGKADETVWTQAAWYPMNKDMIGNVPKADDFSGRFKLAWDEGQLYLLAEIVDDVLFDQHPNPLNLYWDDDCLEIFIDEDKSGGNHQFNFNAFAYHVALDNQAVDIGEQTPTNSAPFILLNDHIDSRWQRDSKDHTKITWEVAIKIFDDRFKIDDSTSQPVTLQANKEMGFMLAYCDNDGSKQREHFMGSTSIQAVNGDKNLGYIDASVFSSLTLKSN